MLVLCDGRAATVAGARQGEALCEIFDAAAHACKDLNQISRHPASLSLSTSQHTQKSVISNFCLPSTQSLGMKMQRERNLETREQGRSTRDSLVHH